MEPAAHSGELILMLVEILNALVIVRSHLADGLQVGGHASLADGKDQLLGMADDLGDVCALVVGCLGNI